MENLEEKKKKSILNNSYKTCENLKGDDFEFYTSVKVDDVGASIYMKDSCNLDSILFGNMVDFVYDLIKNNEKLSSIMSKNEEDIVDATPSDEVCKILKYTKEDINDVFEIIYSEILKEETFRKFLKVSYVFEIISNITNTSYDILFNSLSYKNKVVAIEAFSNEVDLNFM